MVRRPRNAKDVGDKNTGEGARASNQFRYVARDGGSWRIGNFSTFFCRNGDGLVNVSARRIWGTNRPALRFGIATAQTLVNELLPATIAKTCPRAPVWHWSCQE